MWLYEQASHIADIGAILVEYVLALNVLAIRAFVAFLLCGTG